MFTKQDLLTDIQSLGISPEGTLLIHSSMKSIGAVTGGGDTVLDAWMEYMQNGLLLFPTHTWNAIGKDNPRFIAGESPSCVGILTNLFRKREGVVRSLHATHSVGAYGRDAADFVAGEETVNSPCGRQGCWGKLYDRAATILFLGCTLKSNTFIHGVEEWSCVPDRLTESTELLEMQDIDGSLYQVNMHRHHCSRTNDVSQFYAKLEAPFQKLGAIRYGRFGDADCIVADAVKMADITVGLLQKDADVLFGSDPIPADWY